MLTDLNKVSPTYEERSLPALPADRSSARDKRDHGGTSLSFSAVHSQEEEGKARNRSVIKSDSAHYAQAGSPGSAAAAALRVAEQAMALPSPHAKAVAAVRLQPIDRSDPYQASASSSAADEGMAKSALCKPERASSRVRWERESVEEAAKAANNAVAALRDAEKEWGEPTGSSGPHPLGPINEPGTAQASKPVKFDRLRSGLFDAVQTQGLLQPSRGPSLLDRNDLRRMSSHSAASIYEPSVLSMSNESDASDSSEEGNGLEVVDMDLSKYDDGNNSWVIDPQESQFSRTWDLVVMVLMLYTATVTPFEVGLLPASTTWKTPLFMINRVVDLLFLVDICINFFLAYFSEKLGRWEFVHTKIIHRYLTGWFLLDVASTVPYDVLDLDMVGADGLGELRMLRFLRILKVAKLLRILRAGRIFERLETYMTIDYSSLELLKFLVSTFMGMHWLACGLNLVYKSELGESSWLETYFGPEKLYGLDGEEKLTIFEQYIASLYWSAMTITTIGYGDIIPQTVAERVYVTMCMLTGALGYGYIIGAVSGIVATRNQRRNLFYTTMDTLNEYMVYMSISPELQPRLRDYFKFKMKQVDATSYKSLLNMMSPALRGEVSTEVNAQWTDKIACLRDCPSPLLIELALQMEHIILPAAESIVWPGDRLTRIYIIKSGIVLANARVASRGAILCVDALFCSNAISKYAAQTMNFVQLGSLEADVVIQLLTQYPSMLAVLRVSRIKYRMEVEVKSYAAAIKIVRREVEEQRAIAYGMRFRSPKQRKASVLGSLLGGAPEMTEDDERVAFYCNKLRSFLMPVHPWENLRFRNAALRIQRSFRKRREERVKRGNPRLATTAYLLNSGGKELPEDAFQRTMILQMESMQRDQKKLLSLMANQEKLIAELRLRAVGGI